MPEVDGKPRVKPSWVIRSAAPAPAALESLGSALLAAKFRAAGAASAIRAQFKIGSAMRFVASQVVGVEVIPGMRSWGFEARVTLEATSDAEGTEIVVTIDRIAHSGQLATNYTADALKPGIEAIRAAGFATDVSSIFEGKSASALAEARAAVGRQR